MNELELLEFDKSINLCGCTGNDIAAMQSSADQEIHSLAGRRLSYWINPKGSMFGIDAEETQHRFVEGLKTIELISQVRFNRRTKESGSRLRINYLPQSQMHNGALGTARGNGDIKINSTRDVKLTLPYRRTAHILIAHEVGHVLGFGHAGGTDCIMNSNATSIFFCPKEVETWARRLGQPAKPFHPVDRQIAGSRIRDVNYDELREKYKQARLRLVKLRDSTTKLNQTIVKEKGTQAAIEDLIARRKAIHARVLNQVKLIQALDARLTKAAQNWHKSNNRWKGVANVIQLG